MNTFVSRLISPLCIAMLLYNPHSIAAEPINNGTITFLYDLGEGQCTVPVSDKFQLGIYHAGEENEQHPCKGHSVRSIKFNQVRSAVTVTLASHFDKWGHAIGCSYLTETADGQPNNFLIKLRTIKTMPSQSPIALDGIFPEHVGKPIIPGVLLQSRVVHNPDDVNRELSCIIINFD